MTKNFEKDYELFARSKCNVNTNTLQGYRNHITCGMINPTIIEERQLNVAMMDVFSRLMMDRILVLGTSINSDVSNIIASQLLYLDSCNDADITIYINSPGGEVYSGMAIYDVMQFIKSDVSTWCMGISASMGAVLLSSGTKGKRYSLPHSKIMIHQPMNYGVGGQCSDVLIQANELVKTKEMLYEVLSNNTGKTFDEIEEACDRDNWMTPFEAKEFGLIDTVHGH